MNKVITLKGHVSIDQSFFPKEEALVLYNLLYNEISWQEKSIMMFGKEVIQPRLMAWYGEKGTEYKYAGVINKPQSFTKTLLDIKAVLESRLDLSFNSCLANLYRDGNDYMGYHRDNEPELGDNPTIASLSFGAKRSFLLKNKKAHLKESIELDSGSLLLMKGETQKNWHHSLPKRLKVKAPRINLTFRNIIGK